MPKTASQITDQQEMDNVIAAYGATETTLSNAKSKFEILANATTNIADKAKYNAQRLRAEREFALVGNKLLAFQANTAAINPPDAPTVAKVVRLSTDVAQIQATGAAYEAILGIMNSALTELNKIHA